MSARAREHKTCFDALKFHALKRTSRFLVDVFEGDARKREEIVMPSSNLAYKVNMFMIAAKEFVLGYRMNAYANYLLALEYPRRAPIQGLQNNVNTIDEELGIYASHPPFERVWTNLWLSAHIPMHQALWGDSWLINAGMYLNPMVIGPYQTRSDHWASHRLVSLQFNLTGMPLLRQQLSSVQEGDWSMPIITLLWGKINYIAHQQYRDKIQYVIDSQHGGSHPDFPYVTACCMNGFNSCARLPTYADPGSIKKCFCSVCAVHEAQGCKMPHVCLACICPCVYTSLCWNPSEGHPFPEGLPLSMERQ